MGGKILIVSQRDYGEKLRHLLLTHALLQNREIDIFCLPFRFMNDEPVVDARDYGVYFDDLSSHLDSAYDGQLASLSVIFTLQVEPPHAASARQHWNPLLSYEPGRNKSHPREILLSWLVLAFPEVRWIFVSENPSDSSQLAARFHFVSPSLDLPGLADHLTFSFSPLFDGTGFRDLVKQAALPDRASSMNHDDKSNCNAIPQRRSIAAAVDEESSYSYFNAYTAYRFGYRAWPISDWRTAQAILADAEGKIDLLFEDLYLNFPDRPSSFESLASTGFAPHEQRLSSLAFRDQLLVALQRLKYRILVTSGHRNSQRMQSRWRSNQRYLKSLRKRGMHCRILHKPFSGIFDLWRGARLWRRIRQVPIHAQGFEWPPERLQQAAEGSSHSAPGRLLMIAAVLINRCESILQRDAHAVPEAIHAATLALEAKELLCGKTPTTALKALALQHQSEIIAESLFYGIEYNLDVKDRFRDIAHEVKAITKWFDPKTRKRSELNARLTIIESLAKRFRDLNQFEEEQACLAEARRLRFSFWMRQRKFHRLAWPFFKYCDQALRSVPRFIVTVLLVNLLFGLVYWYVGSSWQFAGGLAAYLDSLSASVMFFFTLEPSPGWSHIDSCPARLWNFVLAAQGFISFFNLSLLLAHLYILISRR